MAVSVDIWRFRNGNAKIIAEGVTPDYTDPNAQDGDWYTAVPAGADSVVEYVVGDVFASSLQGVDGGAGTRDEPVDSLDEVAALVSGGDLVRVERGSTFQFDEGRMDIPSDVDVEPYGSGPLAFIDLSTAFDASQWSLASGQSNTYQQTISPISVSIGTVRLFDEGDQTVQRGSISNVESNPGSSYTDKSGDPWIVYFHPKDSSDPSATGREVRYTAEAHAVKHPTNSAGGKIEGIHVRRPMANDGALRGGANSVIQRCIAEDGGKHHWLSNGGVVRDLIARGDTTRNSLSATAGVFFHGSSVTEVQPQICVRYGVRANSTNPLYGHNTSGAGFLDGVSVGEWRWKTDRVGQISGAYEAYGWYSYQSGGIPQGQSGPAFIEGAYIDNLAGDGGSNNKHEHGFTIRNSIIVDSSLIRDTASSGLNFTFENCVVLVSSANLLRDIPGNGGHTVTYNKCLLVNVSGSKNFAIGGTIQGDSNLIFAGSRNVETHVTSQQSLSSLESNTGLSNNAWLTIPQWKALVGDGEIRKGNVQFPSSPDVTHPDGTVAQSLPDGTPISEVGPQRHLDIAASDADENGTSLVWVDSAPTQWPTPPTTRQEEETYVQDPQSWDWKGPGKVDNTEEITVSPLSFWKMDASAGANESDVIGSNDLSDPNSNVGSGSNSDFSYRVFDGSNSLTVDPRATSVDTLHDRLWIAAPVRIRTNGNIVSWWRPFDGNQFRVNYDGSQLQCRLKGGGRRSDLTAFSATFNVSTGSWLIVQLWYNAATGIAGARVDGTESTEYQSYYGADPIDTNRANFNVGGFDGDVGPLMYAEFAPSQADLDWAENGGSFRTLSEFQNHTATVKKI